MFCPNCGSDNSNERRFCFNCGRAFVSARAETSAAEPVGAASPGAERNEFLDSLSGRNEFIDSLSGRNQFLDSLSGYRIDGAQAVEKTIFVPSTDEERMITRAGKTEAADPVFEDEEADDAFEQSLSGLRISESELEEAETPDADGAEIELPVQDADPGPPGPEIEVLDEDVELLRPEVAVESKPGTTWGKSFARVVVILIYGAAAFAVGSAVTMRAFDLPHRIPSITDLPVISASVDPEAPPNGMVFVPGGEFKMGSDQGDAFSRPEHFVTVGPYFIDQTEVTNEAYLEFVKATGHETPPTWVNGKFPVGEERFPVIGVTWYDAAEFAAWSGKRLPTEAEWEFASRGSDGRVYPWGSEWNASAVNAESIAKGARELGQGATSPFGIYDMAGNVWEWTASNARGFSGGKRIPWSRLRLKIIRGGNWQSDKRTATTFFRGFYGASGEKDYKGTGFRCVKDIPKER